VLADFSDVKNRMIRYRLDTPERGVLNFVEDTVPGAARRRIVYTKMDPDHVAYRFFAAGKVTDSGTLAMVLEVRPLSD
jgi:hypothetical protein